MPARFIVMFTVPALTPEMFNVRLFPVPDKVPLVAEPVIGVIVISVETSPVGAPLKLRLIDGVGLPVFAVAVQVTAGGPVSVTVCGPLAIPVRFIETDTVPALTPEIVSVLVFPVPDNAPLTAAPGLVPVGVIVMSVATSPVGVPLKLRLIDGVGLPVFAVAVQVIAGPTSVTV